MFPWAFLPSLLNQTKLFVFRKPYFRESPKIRMSTPARRRLMRDFKRLQQDPPAGQFLLSRRFFDQIVLPGVSGAPSDNNIMLWNAVIFGPHDTPFEVIIQLLFVGWEALQGPIAHIHWHAYDYKLIFLGWDVQVDYWVHRGVSKQTTHCAVCLENVPPKRLCRWGHMPWHPSKQVSWKNFGVR